jgi:hypothetical protein
MRPDAAIYLVDMVVQEADHSGAEHLSRTFFFLLFPRGEDVHFVMRLDPRQGEPPYIPLFGRVVYRETHSKMQRQMIVIATKHTIYKQIM